MSLLAMGLSCSKDDLTLSGQSVKAQVLYGSCAETILQWVNAPNSSGKEWLWFTNPNGPFDKSNPAKIYPNCLSAFEIPTNRQVIGDTLEFTYKELTRPPRIVCAIGGMPTI